MIDCKDLDYCALAEQEEKARATNAVKKAQLETLDWMLNQTMTGMTLPMIRAVIRDKRAEISGE